MQATGAPIFVQEDRPSRAAYEALRCGPSCAHGLMQINEVLTALSLPHSLYVIKNIKFVFLEAQT